jgi:CRP-like cAMP-binding protein
MSIENAYLFQGISEQTRDKISALAVEESHAQGVFLFREGDPARHLYLLREGRVRLSVGNRGLLAHVLSEPGDALGWSSVVEHDAYTASAECLLPVKVVKIEGHGLNQILEKDPLSGLRFFRRLASLIGQRLVNCYQATLSVQGERDMRSYG